MPRHEPLSNQGSPDDASSTLHTGTESLDGRDLAAQMRKRQFSALLTHSPQAIVILDAEGRVREWNPAAEVLLGWTRAEILGGLLHRLIPRDEQAHLDGLWADLRGAGAARTLRSVRLHRDGSSVQVDVHVAPITHADQTFAGVVETLSLPLAPAVTTPTAAGQLFRRAAGTGAARSMPTGPGAVLELDDLTGLPGRRWLQRRLAASLPEGQQRAVAVLDVDAFALVNQGYGPEAGDDVLRELAARWRGLGGAAAVGRWQADEFLCVLDSAQARQDLEDVVGALAVVTREPFQLADDNVRLTISAGMAVTGEVPASLLLRSATAAMGAAKTRGRDRTVWFDPAGAAAPAGGGLRLANDLHRGIQEGELRLHFQPILELATNDVVGVEALVRWERPGVGLLAPGAFIEVAERTGLIVELGQWVVVNACRASVELAAAHLAPVRVSINVSARQLSDPGLVEMLSEALSDTGCDPRTIVVEVTETALLHDITAATAVLEAIALLGVELDLDDFGTGYSSLLYLKHFPVDRIKIDQSFVSGLGTDFADTAIVASTIALAHSVGLTAVAEGVETVDQLTLLRQMGCDFAQGYLLSRPLPQQELTEWLQQHVPSRLLPRERGLDLPAPLGAVGRQRIADRRDQVGDLRDHAADQRDDAGDRRDVAGEQRDQAGDLRDLVGDARDDAADLRDRLADERDRAADRRDDAARLHLRGLDDATPGEQDLALRDVLQLSATAREEAASDRSLALQDRGVGVGTRMQAEKDRSLASADRGDGADERLHAGQDRTRAQADREASAHDRGAAVVDALTGADLTETGLAALRAQMQAARSAGKAMTVVCVSVPAGGQSGGAEGDQLALDSLLVVVANGLGASVRESDLIIRYSDALFVCGIVGVSAVTVAARFAALRTELADPPHLAQVSIGVAERLADETAEQLIEAAAGCAR